jgi:hypothetical protein
MKLFFFHVSHIDLIPEFKPDWDGFHSHSFFWVDDRYHDFTSLKHPEKHIHFFVRDPWAEGLDFTFMQDIGTSKKKLRSYYETGFGLGSAPILRVANILKPDLMASYDERQNVYRIVGLDESFRVFDDEGNLIPFVESPVLRNSMPAMADAFPIGVRNSQEVR